MAAQEQSTKKESGNENENGLISPIQFVAIVAPDKPPQFAYQLLKQGLPHVIVHTKDSKGNPKQKPMIDPAVARQWYEDSMAMKTPRKSREGTLNGEIQGNSIKGPTAYRPGQLLTYQRRPGFCTVAEIRASDADLVYYSTVHGDTVNDNLDTKYTYPFLPEHLKEKILSRKIILDNPRRVLQYVIASLTTLPVQSDDSELAQRLIDALRDHPQQVKQSSTTTALSALEKELEETPYAEPTLEGGDEEQNGEEQNDGEQNDDTPEGE